jgi:NADP-dependent 3-hydroxy acid dehydrogenase YdfG
MLTLAIINLAGLLTLLLACARLKRRLTALEGAVSPMLLEHVAKKFNMKVIDMRDRDAVDKFVKDLENKMKDKK